MEEHQHLVAQWARITYCPIHCTIPMTAALDTLCWRCSGGASALMIQRRRRGGLLLLLSVLMLVYLQWRQWRLRSGPPAPQLHWAIHCCLLTRLWCEHLVLLLVVLVVLLLVW